MNNCDEQILASGTERIELTERQKEMLSKDAQALVEAGFLDDSLELVSRKHFIKYLLLPKFLKEYADLARKELAELDETEVEVEEVSNKKGK